MCFDVIQITVVFQDKVHCIGSGGELYGHSVISEIIAFVFYGDL